MRFLIVATCCLVLAGGRDRAEAIETTRAQPNVLMIAIDDLRPELGCYGDAHVHSPNIDALAGSGRRFERAYCQQAVCNPSRTSLMTGLRPDSIGVTGNHVHFRSKRPEVVTLSQHFMMHGYHAESIGKIYHGVFPDGASKTSWDTMGDPQSWSIPTKRFGPRYYYTESGIEQAKQSYQAMYRPTDPQPDDWTQKLVFGPMTEAPDVDDETLYDGKVAAGAVESLRKFRNTSQPFFLAVGFIKPHSPFVAPKKYWDLYDPTKIELATQVALPGGAPAIAGHGSGEIRRYTDQPVRGEIPEANRRRMKHGYYACISYVDAQVGKVLAALKSEGLEDNTIVVLFSDHGYHLGEHGLWGKTTNFELDTRVPLVVRVPGMTAPGKSTRSIAELVDLYPTIADLAGLPIPSHLEGTSIAAVVTSPAAKLTEAGPSGIALSQYPRGGNADTGGVTMGYSLRTDRWRYTEWIQRESGKAIARELYDHAGDDPIEKQNLAGENQYASVISELSQRLRENVGQASNATNERRQAEKEPIKEVAVQGPETTSTSFEECKAGEFTTVQSSVGRWTTKAGHAEIDNRHRRNGRQCLHLLGGESRRVELTLAPKVVDQSARSFTFHAERWTKRNPFSFRVEQATNSGGWKEIYSGDDEIRIGGFLTKVTIPLEENATRLRFTCTSPAKSGILIDDLTFVPPTPQKIVAVTVAGLAASPFSTADQQQVEQATSNRPNILLIVGEDHGCELSCYGDPVIETPNIDRLASQGVLFESGYVTQSVCSPSRSTIFTGLYPHQNGQLGLATHQFGWFENWPTTYSLLKNAGYRTGLIGKTHVIPADAVESFVDFRFQESANFSKKQVADYAVKAGEFFRASNDPFFMTVNYPDAHWPLQGQVDGLPKTQVDAAKVQVMPYIGGETPRMRQVVQNYYDCMLRLDACVGGLLEQLADSGKADNTLVIFIGDHGAQMARGKVTVYEGGMRVPFIARWPGVIPPDQRSGALVSTIDLLPTFVQAAGVAAPEGLPGRSLRGVFDGTSGDDFRQYLACERNCDAAHITFPQRTIRDARYKLIYSPVRDREDPAARYYRIHGATHWSGCLTDKELAGASDRTKAGYARWLDPPEFQLYDLQSDPHEWNDLAESPEHTQTKARLLAAMKTWQTETSDPLRDPDKLRMLMEETDSVNAAKRRSPKEGWKYLQYWHPENMEEVSTVQAGQKR